MAADLRRVGPRIPVEALCAELHGSGLRHALVVDMSEDGLRIQRPFGGPRSPDRTVSARERYPILPDDPVGPRRLQLELEMPGVDEVGWAAAEVCFDEVRRAGNGAVIRTSGLRLVSAAQRHRRILREYVHDTIVPVRSGSGGCYPGASATRSPAPPLALDRQRDLRRERDIGAYLASASCYLRG